jgi:hypothetical protein
MTRVPAGLVLAAFCLTAMPAAAQSAAQSAAQTNPGSTGGRWEFAALPSIGYDADEGFGYGALAEVYRHRPGVAPYAWTVQPIVEFSSRGRRDVSIFLDAPHLLPPGWRLDGFLATGRDLATPYYGIGNDVPYDAVLDDPDGPDPYFYRFGRSRNRAMVTVQRQVAGAPFRLLLGGGVAHTTVDATPYDRGTTLLAAELAGAEAPGGWSNHMRAGLIRDTRDREVGPSRGSWSELLVQRFDDAFGSDFEYTRWTATDRRYLPLVAQRLVLANRLLLQGVHGNAPFYDLPVIQSSFKQQDGLGGAKTIRGVPKNRYVGKGVFLWNTELRWRAVEFQARGAPMSVVLTTFVDQGRVWDDGVDAGELLTDLHRGFGGGIRLGRGNLVVGLDVGHSREAAAPLYIGLGYLF